MKPSNSYSLHSRVTAMLIAIAIATTAIYLVIVVSTIDKLEDAMLYTLVGHELDELVSELSLDPNAKMPYTASVIAYLKSREIQRPIPEFIEELGTGIYSNIVDDKKFYAVSTVDLGNDRLFVSFDISGIVLYRKQLLILLISGGIFSAIVLIFSGIWFSKKFLAPVNELALTVASIRPDERNIRLESKFQDFEVGLIARAIDDYLTRLDEFIEREQSFAEAVSHELRTPVSVITTSIDLLELRGVSNTQKDVVGRIKTAATYMGKVIESLLIVIRKSQDSLDETLPEIELKSICSKVLKQYQEDASAKNLELHFNCKSRTIARIQENHLEIILGNLVRNAIEYTEKGAIKITLNENSLSVKDSGLGIAAEKIDYIMRRHYQNSKDVSYGFGLYLVVNICNYYGLQLKIESTFGEGSEFLVILPDKMLTGFTEAKGEIL